jgi:hypothetical protein
MKLDDTKACDTKRRSCLQDPESTLVKANFNKETPALDIVLHEDFLRVVCACTDCSPVFGRIEKLLETIENRDQDEMKLDRNLDGLVNTD